MEWHSLSVRKWNFARIFWIIYFSPWPFLSTSAVTWNCVIVILVNFLPKQVPQLMPWKQYSCSVRNNFILKILFLILQFDGVGQFAKIPWGTHFSTLLNDIVIMSGLKIAKTKPEWIDSGIYGLLSLSFSPEGNSVSDIFSVNISASFFLNDYERIFDPEYIPTSQDIL